MKDYLDIGEVGSGTLHDRPIRFVVKAGDEEGDSACDGCVFYEDGCWVTRFKDESGNKVALACEDYNRKDLRSVIFKRISAKDCKMEEKITVKANEMQEEKPVPSMAEVVRRMAEGETAEQIGYHLTTKHTRQVLTKWPFPVEHRGSILYSVATGGGKWTFEKAEKKFFYFVYRVKGDIYTFKGTEGECTRKKESVLDKDGVCLLHDITQLYA